MTDDWRDDSVSLRLARIKRRVRLVIAASAALTAFVLTLAAGDAANGVYAEAPDWMRAVVFTLAVFNGVCLMWAFSGFDSEMSDLERQNDRNGNSAAGGWPEAAERWWTASLVLTVLTPLSFVAVVWFVAAAGGKAS